jgi:C-terminal processing protease CtpA/Prc
MHKISRFDLSRHGMGAAVVLLLVVSSAYAQNTLPMPPPPTQPTDPVVGDKNPAAPQAPAKNRDAKPTRDEDRDARDTAKDETREDRRGPDDRDADRDRDVNRDKDSRDRDQVRENQRDRTRDNRSSDQARSSDSRIFRGADLRSADIGLWFDRSSRDALVISDIASKGAITKVGLQEGDRIVSINGQRVNSERDLMRYLFVEDARNERVKVVVLREGREVVIWIEPAVLLEEYQYVDNDPVEHFGVVLDDRYDDRVVAWKVIPQSPAYYAGIRAGDVFTTFRGQPVTTRNDFVKGFTNLNQGNVPVQVRRGERTRDYTVDVPRYQARMERTALRPNYDRDIRRDGRDERQNRGDERRDTRQDRRQGVAPRNR